MSSIKISRLLFRKPPFSAQELDNIFGEAKLSSFRCRLLAGLSWIILVIGILYVGVVTIDYVTGYVKFHTRVGEFMRSGSIFGQLAAVLGFFAGCFAVLGCLISGSIAWVTLMQRFGVPESLIKAIMLKGPLLSSRGNR